MRVEIRRTGGFAGVEEKLASTELDGAAADEAQALFDRLAKAAAAGETPGADRFRYQIDLTAAGSPRQSVVVVDEGEPLRPAARDLDALLQLVGTGR